MVSKSAKQTSLILIPCVLLALTGLACSASAQATAPSQPVKARQIDPTALRVVDVKEAMAETKPGEPPAAPAPAPALAPGAVVPGQPVQAPVLTNALKFAKPSFDFGDINDTAPVEHEVEFTNISDKTITLAVAASCGCTVAGLEKNTFAPGESGKSKATFNPQGRSGPQTKTLTFTVTNPQGVYSQQTYNITSNVKALVTLDPPKMFMSEVDHKQGKKEKLTVTGRMADFKVTSVSSSSEFIKTTVGEAKVVDVNGEKLTQVQVDIDVGKGAPIGALNGTLTISTNDEKAKLNPYYMGADVVGDLKSTPPQAILRVNTTSTPFTADVRLDSRTGSSFKVTGIDVEARKDMGAVADVKPGPNGMYYILTISGTTPAEPGLVTGTVIVTTDANGGETLRIPFTAAVAKPAPIAGTPAPMPMPTPTPMPAPTPVPAPSK